MVKYVCEIGDNLKIDDSVYYKKSTTNQAVRGHPFNFNNQSAASRYLAKKLHGVGVEIHSYSFFINNNLEPDLVIFNDIPNNNFEKIFFRWKNSIKFLILHESEVVKPWNWDVYYHEYFDKIFTWHLEYIKKEGYIHLPSINSRFNEDDLIHDFNIAPRKKLCTLIAKNNVSNHPLELYSERLKTINWFAKHHKNDFDLYGFGWKSLRIKGNNIIVKILNKLRIPNNLFVKYSIVYKGKVENKLAVLAQYKFNFAYENAINIPGYITEKIFHSFLSGTIPVYLGMSEADISVPKNCYINRREFSSHDDLYSYLVNMSDDEYKKKQQSIIEFLGSDAGRIYSVQNFVEILSNEIIEAIDGIHSEKK